MKKTIVLDLGGSIVVPDKPDQDFLKKFKSFLTQELRKGKYRFIIVIGGGKTCRYYIEAASNITQVPDEDLDWLGIHSTRLNAHLLRTIFRKEAHPKIIFNPVYDKVQWKEDILIAGGWKPGWSTDYVAMRLAKRFKAEKVLVITNIDYVYTKDIKKYPDSKPIPKLSWQEYNRLIGKTKWHPGMHTPIDPIASHFGEKHKIYTTLFNGKDFTNFKNCLEDKSFKGTIISA
jgi:uridylate kinase